MKFGRYEIIKFGSLVSFLVSILLYLEIFIEGLRNVFSVESTVIVRVGTICFSAAMLPFLTDQLIGVTSDELSAVVQWYVWSYAFGTGLSAVVIQLGILPNFQLITGAGTVYYPTGPLYHVVDPTSLSL